MDARLINNDTECVIRITNDIVLNISIEKAQELRIALERILD